jgi:putative IMPACT (imprinted ancient) family translation regulator
MKELTAGKFVEKKSRFYAHLYQIDDSEELQKILALHRTTYKKANHHCYALRYSKQGSIDERYSDDGEVGHPGKALLELLQQQDLDHHVLMVSRIFGGIKLGVGGVTRAFRTAGSSVIQYMRSK